MCFQARASNKQAYQILREVRRHMCRFKAQFEVLGLDVCVAGR